MPLNRKNTQKDMLDIQKAQIKESQKKQEELANTVKFSKGTKISNKAPRQN